MLVKFSRIDFSERPTLILKNAAGSPITTLGYAFGVSAELHLNETSVLQFSVPAYVNGELTPGYDDIVGLREVELLGVGVFKLVNPVETGEGVKIVKQCKAYSLEYEFTLKKITIPNGTYCFWKTIGDQSDTLLGMILKEMPSWRVGKIASTLRNKYRTFEVNNENIYNFIKGTVQKSYNCIFDFDTENRVINVIDVADEVPSVPVYLSPNNLAKKIDIEEDVEGIVTRLDVNGADGVDIRSVNPEGTNRIITLDYYMNTSNFSQDVIDKYYAWKQTVSANRQSYYNLSTRYSLLVAQKVSAETQLTELKNELVVIENELAVTMQAHAQNLGGVTQSTIRGVNARISAKKAEIQQQQLLIDGIASDAASILQQLADINKACKFESYFTEAELLILDRYIKDDDVTESSFVATSVDSNGDNNQGSLINSVAVNLVSSYIYYGKDASSSITRTAKSGTITVGADLEAQIISAAIETSSGNTVLMTVRLGECKMAGKTFPGGMLTISGTYASVTSKERTDHELDPDYWVEEESLSFLIDSAYMYFTMDTSDYEKFSVSWDLYEYGLEVAERLAQPTYTFSITSANFLALDAFESFKNDMDFGKKMYIEDNRGEVMKPICIGASFEYDEPDSLSLQFGDSYLATDATFKMVDLLEQSISMGKSVDTSKYVYSAFVDSGASSSIKDLMDSVLDVSKNAIMSSTDQAITWDGAGLRLRKWENDAKTAYEDEQIWMNNNSIMLTDDGWETAQMAIGKFYDKELGECWGIIAPYVVGTLLAGSNLIIETEKRDGSGNLAFRVDADGAQLYNGKFTLNNGITEILLNPDDGIAIGLSPLYKLDEDGNPVLDIDENGNAKLWIDGEGNIHIRGTLHGVDGTFAGTLDASQIRVVSGDSNTTIGEYLSVHIKNDETIKNIQDDMTDMNDALDGVDELVDGKIADREAIIREDVDTLFTVEAGKIRSEIATEIETVSGTIKNLDTKIEQTKTGIELSVSESIANVTSKVNQNSTDISELGDQLVDLDDKIDSEVTTLTERIAEIKLDNDAIILSVEETVTQNVTNTVGQSIEELDGKVDQVTTDITSIKSGLADIEVSHDSITNRVQQAETTVSNLKTTLDEQSELVSDIEQKFSEVSMQLKPDELKITISETIKETDILQDGLTAVGIHVGAEEPPRDEDGKWQHGKLWVNPFGKNEVWKYYDATKDDWLIVNNQEELKAIQNSLGVEFETFKKVVETWFTFDNDRGLVIQKPRFVDDDGTVYDGSSIYTVTDNTGYHIWNEALNKEIASFESDKLIIQKMQVGKSIMKSTSTGGFVWRCGSAV